MSGTEQEYKDHIKELEQQVRLLKEQVDFLTRKLYGTRSGKTSALQIHGQMSLFNEAESCAGHDIPEPDLIGVEKHLRKKKYAGQREELVKDLPHSKVLHTIDERERICETCGSSMVRVGEEFHDPKASKPAEAILRLNKLFEIEAELEGLSPEEKKKERLIREKQHLKDFWTWAEENALGELPKSKLSTAFHYALNNREEFFQYLEDGNCSTSNSLAENCTRPFVIGRKNWLFAGSPKGAAASAGIYTLAETARANGLSPMKYIRYILADMPGSAFHEHPEYLEDYLPWNPTVREICQ